MDKVKFLEDVECVELGTSGFKYLKDQEHVLELEDGNYYFVRQPNSPKDKCWVTKFPKTAEGKLFQVL